MRTEQSVFSRGRQIEENVLALRLEIERVRERKGELYVAALDVCKAFDSVDREVLVNELRSIEWDEGWVSCARNLYGKEKLDILNKIGRLWKFRGTMALNKGVRLLRLCLLFA